MRRVFTRTLVFLPIGVLLCLAAAMISHRIRVGAGALDDGFARLEQRTAELAEAADGFDDVAAARTLADPDLERGYRFDDRIDEGVCELLGEEPAPVGEILLDWTFDDPAGVPLRATSGAFEVRDGALVIEVDEQDVRLETEGRLELAPDEIGLIEMRMRRRTGRRLDLIWKGPPGEYADSAKGDILTVDMEPGGDLRTYRFNPRMSLRANRLHDAKIEQILISIPKWKKPDRVEIDAIRFHSKSARYALERCGTFYESLGGRLRKTMWTHAWASAPAEMKWRVRIPETPARLSFGAGMVRRSANVRSRAELRVDGETQTLWEDLLSADDWRDVRLDLDAWAGKDVEIVFRAEVEDDDPATHNIALWSNPVLLRAPDAPRRIFLILEDTLRADRLSLYGHPVANSPVKEALADRGVVFERAISASFWTRPSVPSIMTGLYPAATGVQLGSDKLSPRYLTLAEALRSMGFATSAWVQNPVAGTAAGLAQGFGEHFDPKNGVGERAEQIYGEALQTWLEEHRERDVFVYLHLLDPHGPYDPPEPWNDFAPPKAGSASVEPRHDLDPPDAETATEAGRRSFYDGEIAYNDHHLGRFLEFLRESDARIGAPRSDDWFVFLSDHGESLGEHGRWGHVQPGYRQVLHVPLLMVAPGALPEGVRVDEPVSLVDVMPTLLDLLGADASGMLFQGRSLAPAARGEERAEYVVLSDEPDNQSSESRIWGSVFFRDWHMIGSPFFLGSKIRWESDLDASRYLRFYHASDPEQKQFDRLLYYDLPLKAKITERQKRIEDASHRVRDRLAEEGEEAIDVDPGLRERMKELGYLD